MTMPKKIPERSEIPVEDTWDLSSLYADMTAWEKDMTLFSTAAKEITAFRGRLAESKETLCACLDVYSRALQTADSVGNYAFLCKSGDEGDSANQDCYGRFVMAVTAFEAEISFLEPEIQAIPDELICAWLPDSSLDNYRVYLSKMLRLKPYIKSEQEERVMTLYSEPLSAAHNAFSVLTNVDMDFGTVTTQNGEEPLSQSSWSVFMESSDRNIRKEAYTKFYKTFDAHKNTLAALYSGSVAGDVARSRSRGYTSARACALFPDAVPESVYDNLVATVRQNIAPLHRYYELRKKMLKVDELRHYDVYVPFVERPSLVTPYNDAVTLVTNALAPLGDEYTGTLYKGLTAGWVDKYENKGKRSGAFSSGGYRGYPYILLNYKEDVIRDVFTIAHEGGHSMHSFYSARNNPFMQYDYTIFEAEVASTFNEELLFRYMLRQAQKNGDKKLEVYLLCTRASDILATLFRQTMFAEFEMRTHTLAESGTPLTADLLRSEYRTLLTAYFGPTMVFESVSDLEGLRIPHFYRAFYVYKYATGISAALALADRVLSGGETERNDYFTFLKSGGSRYPLESLRIAGVDMAKPEPVQAACHRFAGIVEELERITSNE